MQEIKGYKVAWNAARDEGTILLNTKFGLDQIYLNSAAEGLLITKILRECSPVYVQNGVLFTGFEDVDEAYYERLREKENEVSEIQEIRYDLRSGVVPSKREREAMKKEKAKEGSVHKEKVHSTQETKDSSTIKSSPKGKSNSKSKLKSSKSKVKSKKDNLKLIEGIGPKIAELLIADGIETFKALSETSVTRLKKILNEAGSRFSFHDPSTWARQAKIAAAGKIAELKEWQNEMKGGKEY